MSQITAIDYTFHADSCGDDETAAAFGRWAEAELQRRYPDASVRVEVSYRTSGVEPVPSVETDAQDLIERDRAEDAVQAEIRRLWADWERAGWPVEA
jgi:hypothetical protein